MTVCDGLNDDELRRLAGRLRYQTLLMINRAKTSHIGSNFSIAELLAVLYGRVLRVDPRRPDDPERDRFVLSKGHACAALYAVLSDRGFFPAAWLESFCQNGSRLAGHATRNGVPGIEVSTGSLGHGLSIGTGMALAAKQDKRSYRVFVLLSDGECDEGSTWEPAMFANQWELDNLVAIVDYNKIQSLGRVDAIMKLEPFADKWRSFGWNVQEIDGNDIKQISKSLTSTPFRHGAPSCLIAHTVKGKGVDFMENKVLWHYRSPQGQEFSAALEQLGGEERR